MITTVRELKEKLKQLDEDKFIIVYCKDNKQDYAIEDVAVHIENGHANFEIRVGKNVL